MDLGTWGNLDMCVCVCVCDDSRKDFSGVRLEAETSFKK